MSTSLSDKMLATEREMNKHETVINRQICYIMSFDYLLSITIDLGKLQALIMSVSEFGYKVTLFLALS